MKRHHDQGNSYKVHHLIRAGLQFRGSVGNIVGKKHTGLQADMVAENCTSGLAGSRKSDEVRGLAWVSETSEPAPRDNSLQRSHTYSSKATSPNGATVWVYRSHFHSNHDATHLMVEMFLSKCFRHALDMDVTLCPEFRRTLALVFIVMGIKGLIFLHSSVILRSTWHQQPVCLLLLCSTPDKVMVPSVPSCVDKDLSKFTCPSAQRPAGVTCGLVL